MEGGASTPTDAEMAARAVLAGVANATPKSGEGGIEMIRMLKSTKGSAVKARTQAINQMKALVVTAPAGLRESLRRSDGLCPHGAVQELPSGSSRGSHGGGQVHPSVPGMPLPST